MSSSAGPTSPAPPDLERKLESWKGIASYLDRDVRTVQRWEKVEALPVHRLGHKKLGGVYAYTSELDAWAGRKRSVLDRDEGRKMAWRGSALWAAAGVAAASALFLGWRFTRPEAPDQYLQVEIGLPPQSVLLHGPSLALSPDGSRLVLAATEGLWVRDLRDMSVRPLAGTRDALNPFWSPDGREIGFFANGKLKKLAPPGGTSITLAAAPAPQGAAWSPSGKVIFAPSLEGPLMTIPAGGGSPVALTSLDASRQEYVHCCPVVLPGGRQILFLARSRRKQDDAVMSVELNASPARRPELLFASASGVHFLPGRGSPDQLLFLKESYLVSQRLDLRSLRLSGDAVPIALRVRRLETGQLDVSVSQDGTLAFVTEDPMPNRPKWIDRDGNGLGEVGEPGEYRAIRLSRDQRRLATVRTDPAEHSRSLWFLDLSRGVDSRLLVDAKDLDDPVWSPDGSQLAFSSERGGSSANLYLRPSTGLSSELGELKPVLPPGKDRWPLDWSPDGSLLLFAEIDPVSQFDIWALPMKGGGPPFPVARGPGRENEARFSPDGKYIAYHSDESGHVQVYIQALPPASGKWQVSTDHGAEPRWSGDGGELFYLSGDGALMAAPILARESELRPGKPTRLFGGRAVRGGTVVWKFEPAGDGGRFLILTPSEKSALTPIHLRLRRPGNRY